MFSITKDLARLDDHGAQQLLFRRLFDCVAQGKPQVPLNDTLWAIVEDWRDRITDSRPISEDHGQWLDVFQNIVWDRTSKEEVYPCYAGIVELYGVLADELGLRGDFTIPTSLALVAFSMFQDEPNVVAFGEDDRGCWCGLTPVGVSALGLSGRAYLDKAPPDNCPLEVIRMCDPGDRLQWAQHLPSTSAA